MGNNKPFKVKNSIQAPAYRESLGTVTTKSLSYDIENLSYEGKVLSGLDSVASTMYSFEFKPDGTKLWTMSNGIGAFYEFNLSTPWDVSTATYANKFEDISTSASRPRDFRIKEDGTKMLVYNDSDDAVYEYTMLTPWDINSLTAPSVDVLGPNLTDNSPTGMAVSKNGEVLILVGNATDIVRRYALTAPYDLTGAVYNAAWNLDLQNEQSTAFGVEFDFTGTQMFINGISPHGIHKYTLGTAYRPDTAYGDPIFIANPMSELAREPAAMYCMRFKPDGSTLYILDPQTASLYQFQCNTERTMLDTSTGSVFDVPVSKNTQISFKARNTWNFTITNNTSLNWVVTGEDSLQEFTNEDNPTIIIEVDDIIRFTNNANSSHPLYISTNSTQLASYYFVPDVVNQGANSGSTLSWSPSETGTYYYKCSNHTGMKGIIQVIPKNLDRRFQVGYGLPKPQTKDFGLNMGASSFVGFHVSRDGNHLYAITGASIQQYALSTPYDITTATYVQTDDVNNRETNSLNRTKIVFNDDGTRAYILHNNARIFQVDFATPWDVSTLSYSNVELNLVDIVTAGDLDISRSGEYMYVTDFTNSRIRKYNLNTPWDLSTAEAMLGVLSRAGTDSLYSGVAISNDGKHIAVTTNTEKIYQYDLIVPYSAYNENAEVINLSSEKSDTLSSTTAVGLQFSYTGEYLYMISSTGGQLLNQYKLSKPVSDSEEVKSATAIISYSNTAPTGAYTIENINYTANNYFDLSNQNDQPMDIAFKTDGTKMYMLGTGANVAVYEYNLGTPWDVTTAGYTSTIDISSYHGDVYGFYFRPNGERMYVAGNNGTGTAPSMAEYRLSTYWDISTVTYQTATNPNNPSGISNFTANSARAIQFRESNGQSWYGLDNNSKIIYEYTVAGPWDINNGLAYNTGQGGHKLDVWKDVQPSSGASDPRAFQFTPDGRKLFVADYPYVLQYTLDLAWDIYTATFDNVAFDLSSVLPGHNTGTSQIAADSLRFSTNGDRLYAISANEDRVYQFDVNQLPQITYNSEIRWRSGSAPTAPERGDTDIITFTSENNGLTFEGVLAIDGAK